MSSNVKHSDTSDSNKIETKESKLWGIYYLSKTDLPMREIARIVDMPRSSVQNIIARIKTRGTPLPRKSPGSKPKANERTLRHLSKIIKDNPSASYSELQNQLRDLGVTVHKATLQNYIKELGFKSCMVTRTE